jgi:hypothetical protein
MLKNGINNAKKLHQLACLIVMLIVLLLLLCSGGNSSPGTKEGTIKFKIGTQSQGTLDILVTTHTVKQKFREIFFCVAHIFLYQELISAGDVIGGKANIDCLHHLSRMPPLAVVVLVQVHASAGAERSEIGYVLPYPKHALLACACLG